MRQRATNTRGRVPRRWRGGVATAAFVALAAAAFAPSSTNDGPSDLGEELRFSMVEFLDDDDNGPGVVTLSNLRRDVLGYSSPLTLGAGVDVAVVDSGVAPVDGLDGDKVMHGPDLSDESEDPDAAYLDSYGHGTHIAGIIAGERAGAEGIAPGAGIVSLKVAGADGATTVPQVIAAIDWVIQHRNSDGLNIRVLNLALGQADVSSNQGDLLSAAVERAWDAGIVVVVAAGNRGETQAHLDSPAVSPYVIAVGASDSAGGDDDDDDLDERTVPSWSGRGDATRVPDVVAPGRSIASYRVPGSTIDDDTPSAVYNTHFFRGSGTSQSSAVVAGLAAALIAERPELTADQVKDTIEERALRLEDVSTSRQGDGHIRGSRTLSYSPITHLPADEYERALPTHDASDNGNVDTHDETSDPTADVQSPDENDETWSGGTWSGATWSGATWSGATWSGATWSAADWLGATWSGATWSGATWSGATWSGATWSGATWSSGDWNGATWSANGWS
ncbi:MAG: S8 family serine peptidase [Ilumatobacter sp.]|uniref:S8 family serine peptidase n=1 Tax=Ilumatobacter sp. TaxID=1967498 RepID=UPI00262F32A7|nr:S8 family serine peptidase [Ilumatobacter sp.]MDJ0769141.1 S8 family serine peptidase [Ilumatobacter sp.]